MAKLVAVKNYLDVTFSLTNAESKEDNRLLPPGTTLVLGKYNEGIDIPKFNPGNASAHIITVTGELDGERLEWKLCNVKDQLHLLQLELLITTPVTGHGVDFDTIELWIGRGKQLSWSYARMPTWLSIPKLVGIENGLPSALHMVNFKTAQDSVDFVNPGALTPVPGQYGKGADIPECRDRGSWPSRRIQIKASSGDFQINLFRVGYDIYYSHGPDYPAALTPVPGGHSQGDGPKYLSILGEKDIRLVNEPLRFAEGWNNWPSPGNAEIVVHADVDLMNNPKLDGNETLVEVPSYVTRLTIRDRDNRPIPDATIRLAASPAQDADVNGEEVKIPALGEWSQPLNLDQDGAVTLTHATGSLGAPLFRVQVIRPSRSPYLIDVHPSEKVSQRLQALGTDDAWKREKDKKGNPLLPANAKIPKGAAGVIKDFLKATTQAPDKAGVLLGAPSPGVVARGIAQVHRAAAPTHQLNLEEFEDGHCWGFDFRNGNRALVGDEARVHLAELRALQPIGQPIVLATRLQGSGQEVWPSLWERVEQFFKDAWSFVCQVVGGVMKVVYKIAEIVFEVVFTIVSEVFQAISVVLDKVFHLNLERIVDWLGAAFDWNVIKDTHEALRRRLTGTAGTFEGGTADAFKRSLDDLPRQLRSFRSGGDPAQVAAFRQTFAAISERQGSQSMRDHHDSVSSSPAVRWAPQALTSNLAKAALPEFDVLGELWTEISAIAGRIEEKLRRTFETLGHDYNSLTFGRILEILAQMAGDVLAEIAEAIIDIVAKLSAAMVAALRSLLETRWEIPLISTLYRKHIDSKGNPTALELCCFVVATATTMASQLLVGEAPFPKQPAHTSANASGAMASATVGQVSPESRAAQLGLGIATSTCQLFAGFCFVGGEVVRITSGADRATLRAFLAGKIVFDTLGYALSLANIGVYSKSVGDLTTRHNLDIFLVAFQGVFRAKDLFRLVTFNDPNPPVGYLRSGLVCAVFESGCALSALIALIGDMVLQSKEPVTAPITAAQNREIIASKALQLSGLVTYQLFAFPRELAVVDKKAEVAVVTIRTLLLLLVPAAGLWRSQLNFTLQQPHDVIS